MTDTTNPWLPKQQASAPTTQHPGNRTSAAVTGPTRPQRGVPAPDLVDQLPIRHSDQPAVLWIVGAHGGAGESSLAELDDTWRPGGHAWPCVNGSQPARVVVVARTSSRGLLAAKSAAKQWATGLVQGVELLGLVLIADAPGRLPKPLRDFSKVVAGGYPRTWQVPWIESWRLGEAPASDTQPRDARRLVDDVRTLLQPGASPGATN